MTPLEALIRSLQSHSSPTSLWASNPIGYRACVLQLSPASKTSARDSYAFRSLQTHPCAVPFAILPTSIADPTWPVRKQAAETSCTNSLFVHPACRGRESTIPTNILANPFAAARGERHVVLQRRSQYVCKSNRNHDTFPQQNNRALLAD